jgi:hypothetical protein
MKTIKNHWGKLTWAASLASLAVIAVYACISAWGQTLPGLSIAMTNANSAVSLVVTNGTNTGKYQIYWTEFLSTAPEWELVTNGGTGVTNFLISIGDDTQGFFEARNNTNSAPFILNLTVQSPANGANIQ